MPWDLTDDKSTLVQVMAWCRQATSHYLSQWWPSSMSPYGVTRPQWVKLRLPLSVGLSFFSWGRCIWVLKDIVYLPMQRASTEQEDKCLLAGSFILSSVTRLDDGNISWQQCCRDSCHFSEWWEMLNPSLSVSSRSHVMTLGSIGGRCPGVHPFWCWVGCGNIKIDSSF